MINIPQRVVAPNDRFKKDIHQDLREFTQRSQPGVPGKNGQLLSLPGGSTLDFSPSVPIPYYLGYVTNVGPNGDADLTGATYWVSIAVVHRQSGDLLTASPTVDENTDIDPTFRIIAVTNLSELQAGSHSLAVGTPVEVHYGQLVTQDIADFTRAFYYIPSSGGSNSSGSGQKKGMVLQDVTDNSTGFDYVRIVKTY